MRVASRRLGALVAVAWATVAVWLPSSALAAGTTTVPVTPPGGTTPFSPGGPQAPITVPQQTTPTVVTGTSTSSTGGGLSGTSAVAIAIGAMVVLGGISYFIWHDSRRHARLRHGAGSTTAAGAVNGASRGSKAPPKPRKLSPAERRRRKRGRARRSREARFPRARGAVNGAARPYAGGRGGGRVGAAATPKHRWMQIGL